MLLLHLWWKYCENGTRCSEVILDLDSQQELSSSVFKHFLAHVRSDRETNKQVRLLYYYYFSRDYITTDVNPVKCLYVPQREIKFFLR